MSNNIPADLYYVESHEWIKLDVDIATVGITDHAQNELSDVVFVELPAVHAKVAAGAPIAVVESVKAASDIYSPVRGEILEVNETLTTDPAQGNTDPYGKGWIFKIKLDNLAEVKTLKDAAAYAQQLGA